MNDFARTQLMKYGWSEGKGLGKHESGIAQALKPQVKFDTAGIGYKSDDYSNWWETAYNKAANNITVKPQANGVFITVSKKEGTENVPQNKLKEIKSKSSTYYGNFIKSVLLDGNLVENNISISKTEDKEDATYTPLTDEELFVVCGGRTAHKGARHGLTLNGKLKRIAEQEAALLNKNSSPNTLEKLGNNNNISDDEYAMLPMASVEKTAERKISKTVQRRERKSMSDLSRKLNSMCNLVDDNEKNTNEIVNEESNQTNKDRKKKKKKKRKISDSCVKIEKDLLFVTYCQLEEERMKENSEEYLIGQADTEHTKTSKEKKKLRMKKEQEEFIEHPTKKFKKCDKNHLDVNFLEHELQKKHFFKESLGTHKKSDSIRAKKSSYSYAAQKAMQLNKKSKKKKRAKRQRKERMQLEKITQCLEAVHFNVPESNVEQRKKKLKEMTEKLIDTNTAIDRTECFKKWREDKK